MGARIMSLSEKRILLAGGGTGGHIYPALAIADELKLRLPDAEIRFAGTREGLESAIVPKAGYSLELIRAAGIERRLTLSNISNLSQSVLGIADSNRLLGAFKPDLVIGTGGYVCGPVLLSARLRKIPILLQEQNAVLGVTNRLLSRFADRIALGVPEAMQGIANKKDKIFVTGNPVRPEFFSIRREDVRLKLGLSDEQRLIVITGGSRGARNLNLAALELHQAVIESHPNWTLIHATGRNQWEEIKAHFEANNIPVDSKNQRIVPYLEDMPELLHAADLVVSRAGALALAEIAACGLPAILIPYPYAAENHQEKNASTFVAVGAAAMLKDRELQEGVLLRQVEDILNTQGKLAIMGAAAKQLAKPKATEEIADLAIELLAKGDEI